MASTAEAVATKTAELPQDLNSKLDRLFADRAEAPTQEPEPEAETVQAEPEPSGDEASTAETSDETAEEVIEVEFNGTKYQVPPELKEVLMKSSDYTQKTQSLAQQRRDMEIQQKELALIREHAAFTESVATELDTLKMLDQYIPYMKQNTAWDSLSTDQFVRKQKEIQDLIDQRSQLANALQGKHAEHKSKVETERKKLKGEMSESLKKAIPGWSEKVQGEVDAYVKALGYPEIALPNMSSLDYQVAWKAAQYDKLKSSSASAVKKAAEAPAIRATSRKEMPGKVKEMLNTKRVLKTAKPGSAEQKAAIDRRLSQLFGG